MTRMSGGHATQRRPHNWTGAVAAADVSLREAIGRLDAGGLQVVLLLDTDGHLAGLLSDGDVRRAVLRGTDLDTPAASVMNVRPLVADTDTSDAALLSTMRDRSVRQIPIVDRDNRVVGLATLESLVGQQQRPNWVVIMAGGMGRRLLPMTQSTPKPALRIGDQSILEITVAQLQEQGFRHIFMAVNYLADAIVDVFGDGHRHGVDITYLREQELLGTAGALSLLPGTPDEPIIVMNGDLLTRMRFDCLLAFHADQGTEATMAVREYDIQIPFGVVGVDGPVLLSVEEKPVQRFFVNAGIYAMSPASLRAVPKDTPIDMPALFQRLIAEGRTTSAFPLREYWIDIGRIEELERAQREWHMHAGNV